MSQITKVRSSSRSGRRRCVAAVRLEHGRFDGSSEKSSPKTQRRKYREGYFESRYTSQKSPGLSVSNSMLGTAAALRSPQLSVHSLSLASDSPVPRSRPATRPARRPPASRPTEGARTTSAQCRSSFTHLQEHLLQSRGPESQTHLARPRNAFASRTTRPHTHTHTRISPHTKPSTKVSRPQP